MTEAPRDANPVHVTSDPAESVTRGFLFADLRGYTEYAERLGGEAAAQLLGRYRDLVRIQVARFRGAEIKTEGDSFYVVFPAVSAAVRAALAILERAAAENAATTPADPIRVGIGVHAGETVETSEGYVGTAVNIAARLCAQAAAGEVLVSDTVRALTSNVVRAHFVAVGRRQLKGISEPVSVFAVRVPSGTSEALLAPRRRDRRALALGAVAATAGLGIIAVVGLAGLVARPDPGSSPASGTAVSGPPVGSAPTGGSVAPDQSPATSSGLLSAERDLLELIPADVAQHCRPAPDDAAPRAATTFRCDLPIGSGADTVWWDAFLSRNDMTLTFEEIADARRLPEADCATSQVTRGVGAWELGRTFSGDLLCYADGDAVWVVWTYRDQRLLSRAVRDDGDWETLQAWWRDISPLLRSP